MQNFSPLALKLTKEIEDDIQTYCKTAKNLLLIFAELSLWRPAKYGCEDALFLAENCFLYFCRNPGSTVT